MVFPSLVVFGFITKPPTMIRLFAELSGHYPESDPYPVPTSQMNTGLAQDSL
jgi:hypothetical protein